MGEQVEGILNEGGIVILNPFRVGYAKFCGEPRGRRTRASKGAGREGGLEVFHKFERILRYFGIIPYITMFCWRAKCKTYELKTLDTRGSSGRPKGVRGGGLG